MDGLAAPLADHRQIRLPHVRADKLDPSGQFLADQGKELLEARHRPLAADPQQARAVLFDLVDQRQVFVTLGILDLIDTDRRDRAQLPVLDPPLHDRRPTRQTLSQVVRNDTAVSCHASFRAQCARNSM